MKSKKVLVVGAGPGGLSAAMLLSKLGHEVVVVEKDAEVGGRNSAIRLGPYTFDTGPTFLMMAFVLKQLFKDVGRKLEDELKFYKLDPMYRLSFKDFAMDMTSDPQRMGETLENQFPGSKKGFFRFLEKEETRFKRLMPCLQKPYAGIKDYFDVKLMRAATHISLGKSMFEELGQYFEQDDLKLCFTFQSKYLGMSAWECPALFTMIPYVEHRYGIFHVHGGLNAISHAMARIAKENGATIRTSHPVKKVLVKNGKAVGLEYSDGSKESADAIFMNADFAYAATNLFEPGLLKKYSPSNIRKLKYSCSTYMLYLGLDKRYDDLPHHNIYFAKDYRSNVDDVFKNGMLSPEYSFYVQNASVTDSSLAPEGHSTIYMLAPVPNNSAGLDWEKERDPFREKMLSVLEDRVGLKDIRQHIVQEKRITPQGWASDYNVYIGATFNLSHNMMQLLNFRPQNKFEEVENVYLVGGGTHPGSGLPTIYESARISTRIFQQSLEKSAQTA